MSQRTAGFDIGSHSVHIAICQGSSARKMVSEPLPEGMVRDQRIISYEAMGDFIKQVMRKRRLRAYEASVVLPSSLCYCRRLLSPVMTDEQLGVNLPYEFRDYITDKKENYSYDYAVLQTVSDSNGKPIELDLLAAAALKSTVQDYKDMFRRAGMKLRTVIPVEAALTNLLSVSDQEDRGQCIVDLGHSSVRMYMFSGNRFEASHILDFGCAALDSIISDSLHVDPFIAASYREANHDDCQHLPKCMEIYRSIALEINRAIYFNRYNNPDSEIERLRLIGGGARLAPLIEILKNIISVPVEDGSSLIDAEDSDSGCALLSAGAAIQH